MAAGFARVVASGQNNENSEADIDVAVSGVTVGNRLVVCVQIEDQHASGVSDDAGNTYALDKELLALGNGYSHARIYSAHVASAPDVVTITKTGSGDRPTSYAILELSSVEAASAVRTTGANSGGNTATWNSGASADDALTGDIGVSFVLSEENVAFGHDAPAVEAVEGGGANGGLAGGQVFAAGYALVGGDAPLTIGGSRGQANFTQWAAAVVVYKGAAASGGGSRRTLLGVGS